MLKTIFVRVTNTGSTGSVFFKYQRASDKMWQYQVELEPQETKNIWYVENTFSTFFDNPPILIEFYFPSEVTSNPIQTPTPSSTPLPTPTITSTPSPTPTITSTPSSTPQPSVTPTTTSTPTPTPTIPEQVILNAIITNDGNYIEVGDNEYLKYVDPI